MITRRMLAIVVAAAAIAYAGILMQAQSAAPAVKRTVLLQHDISAPGFEAVLVAVEIPVGGREGRHFHSGNAMIHVTDGAITLDECREMVGNFIDIHRIWLKRCLIRHCLGRA